MPPSYMHLSLDLSLMLFFGFLRKKKKKKPSKSHPCGGSTHLPDFPHVLYPTGDLTTRSLYYSDVPMLRCVVLLSVANVFYFLPIPGFLIHNWMAILWLDISWDFFSSQVIQRKQGMLSIRCKNLVLMIHLEAKMGSSCVSVVTVYLLCFPTLCPLQKYCHPMQKIPCCLC